MTSQLYTHWRSKLLHMVIRISTYEYVIEFGGDMENQAKLVIAKMLKRQLKLSLELKRNLQSKYMLINLICLHFVNSQGLAFYHINIKLLNLFHWKIVACQCCSGEIILFQVSLGSHLNHIERTLKCLHEQITQTQY